MLNCSTTSLKTSVTLTTGFTDLFNGNNVKDLGFILAKAGFKAFVFEDRFYVLGEVGAGFAVTNGYNDTLFYGLQALDMQTNSSI